MSENLATIQRIKEIKVHTGADALELATVLGWQVVVKKGEFKPGDLVVYIAIDTILPEKPEFEFLRNKNFRIKPIRLRGQESAGICFPVSILRAFTPPDRPWDDYLYSKEGDDVTYILNIKHYEKPVPAELAGQAKGMLPGFIIMTDELNLRSYPDALPELWGKHYYITIKDDGCLDKDTIIITEDGPKTIETIHSEQYRGKCLSYNINDDITEYDVITDSIISNNNSEWYEIELDDSTKIKITGNHKVWLPAIGCYREVKELRENDIFLAER